MHDAGRPHDVDADCCTHAPAAQRPVLPHAPFAAQFGGSAVLLATFAQVPLALTLQDWQAAWMWCSIDDESSSRT